METFTEFALEFGVVGADFPRGPAFDGWRRGMRQKKDRHTESLLSRIISW
jgi:hypothetical protein